MATLRSRQMAVLVSAFALATASSAVPAQAEPGPCSATTSTVGSDTVVMFTTVGTCTWVVPAGVTNLSQVLVVGGGGGGGFDVGGGGGAGGLISLTNQAVSAGSSLEVVVGDGGLGNTSYASSTASDGSPSSILGYTALGGGQGGSGGQAGVAGGSGGGAGYGANGAKLGGAALQTSPGLGSAGGAMNAAYGGSSGAGGGGATAAGQAAEVGGVADIGGNGGSGYASSITGAVRYYAGGGGGASGAVSTGVQSLGGSGVGGNGGSAGLSTPRATPGTANTGSGGGGGNGSTSVGGAGGSGVVIVRYPSTSAAVACAEGTDYTSSTSGDYVIVTFTNTAAPCTFTMPVGSTVDYLAVGGGGGGGGGSLRYTADGCTYAGGAALNPPKPGGGGAGGGGGQAVSGTFSAAKDDSLTVQVGAGGAGGKGGGCPVLYTVGGVQFTASEQANYTADGNGGAGEPGSVSSLALNATTPLSALGGTGGSGAYARGRGGNAGGMSGGNAGGANTAATTNCDYNAVDGCWAAPGGAGAGDPGSNIQTFPNTCEYGALTDANGGSGGTGFTWSITGLTYGGGGGGSIRHPGTNPTSCSTNRQPGSAVDGGGAGNLGNGISGSNGRGGGGGGGRGNGASIKGVTNAGLGGNGGNGTVILRFLAKVLSSDVVITDATQTCTSVFLTPTATPVTSVLYTVSQQGKKAPTIGGVSPGSFMYWAKVTSGTVTVTQSNTGGFSLFPQASGSQLFDANCLSVKGAKVTSSGASSSVTVPPGGGTYYLSIKYSPSSLVGSALPATPSAVYTFANTGFVDRAVSLTRKP